MIYSKALGLSIPATRLVGKLQGSAPGPTVVFVAGIHGNEPSGVFALHQLIREVESHQIRIKGNVYAISGNLGALIEGERYKNQDLNRMWSKESVRELLLRDVASLEPELREQRELYDLATSILKENSGPFYFMDLHTTSSATVPFLTVNDSLLNRKFTKQYPLPIVLGIEEYLDGPMLSYINELGYVSFGFEGGQHDDPRSVQNHLSFAYLSLVYSGSLSLTDFDFKLHHSRLSLQTGELCPFYEILHRHEIAQGKSFTMNPGFENFTKIVRHDKLAKESGTDIKAARRGRIFMPLYQQQGNDGFFIIRRVSPFFLGLSKLLRRTRIDRVLPLLPGVRWLTEKHEVLSVNRRIARFMTKPFFHLLGYRSRQVDRDQLVMKNRESASRTADYEGAPWM
jgi:hypothetical protein